jgi:hypothetical protein
VRQVLQISAPIAEALSINAMSTLEAAGTEAAAAAAEFAVARVGERTL